MPDIQRAAIGYLLFFSLLLLCRIYPVGCYRLYIIRCDFYAGYVQRADIGYILFVATSMPDIRRAAIGYILFFANSMPDIRRAAIGYILFFATSMPDIRRAARLFLLVLKNYLCLLASGVK